VSFSPIIGQIESVKEKLYTHCGTRPHFQRLILQTSDGAPVRRVAHAKSKPIGLH
jgi:hypothetical protein